MHHAAGWGMPVWLILFGVLLVAGLVILTVLMVRLLRGGLRPDGASPRGAAGSGPAAGFASARQILAERYARGEIDTEEFQTRSRALEGS